MAKRKPIYGDEIRQKIIDRLRDGESLRAICRDEGMPVESIVRRWAEDDPQGYGAQYAKARDAGLEHMADELLEIADDGTNDWMEKRNSEGDVAAVVADHEHINRSRLRVDTRKWLLSKMAPKRYGDRLIAEHSGPDGGPIETKDVSAEELARRLAFLLMSGAKQ